MNSFVDLGTVILANAGMTLKNLANVGNLRFLHVL